MPQTIVGNWLKQLTRSVKTRDLDAHMRLVSERVQIYGLPGGQIIGYAQWKKRRYTEFSQAQLLALDYRLLNLKTITARRLGFHVEEIMQACNGMCIYIDKDIILEREQDEQWRVVEENIHHWKIEQAQKIS
ncbi:hypothetical protein MNBD_GAMMA25-1684 [hydrothermal vent metagenome]|uniref:Uncharacterized protein n=1 Tax=hydrothermal vent metagenome TaxID=652676 RepID=A0A3B1BII2_9ZZZZ